MHLTWYAIVCECLRIQGQILDSKDFYAPLITPYEAQLAFAAEGGDVSDDYRLDFDLMLGTAPQASTSGEGE